MFKKMKSIFGYINDRIKHAKIAAVALVAGIMLQAGVSHAALSIDQQAVVTAIDTLYTDMSTAAWGFVLTATTLFLGIKIFKKAMGRAT